MPRNPDRLNASAAAYAARELNFRANALPETVDAYDDLKDAAAALGIVIGIADLGGVRTEAQTRRALQYREIDWANAVKANPSLPSRITKENWRPIAPFGSSMHNYGAAFDAFIIEYPTGRSVQWAHDQLDLIAPKLGLKIGDNFRDKNGNPRPDEPHFERLLSLAEARAAYVARGNLQCPACGGSGRVGHVAK